MVKLTKIDPELVTPKKSGRKPLEGGSRTIAFTLTNSHADAIKNWKASNGCRSDSEALRQIIDHAVQAA